MRTSQTAACRPKLRRVAPPRNMKMIQRDRRRSAWTRALVAFSWALLIAGTVSIAGVAGFFIGIILAATS